MAQHSPRIYDHRIREQVVCTGNPDLFPELEIPRSTALSWIRRGARDVLWRQVRDVVERAFARHDAV